MTPQLSFESASDSSVDPLFLETAVEVALEAGRLHLKGLESGFTVDKKGTIDLVTEVDRACEQMFRKIIIERFPDHDILAEEFGSHAAQSEPSRYRWIFDPLDGTTNYAHGLPIFCASLALEIDKRTVIGVVYDPSRRELFTAERGKGAFLNGAVLHVSQVANLVDGLLVTGFPYDVHERVEEMTRLFGAFLGQARAVRRLGSAALDLCYIAAGRFDGFWEQSLKTWDVSAGGLLVEEAGGLVTGMDGSPFESTAGHLVASNGHLHKKILEVIDSVNG